jgi:hypothetical protein
MSEGPGTEAMNQDLAAMPFAAYAIDVWDGVPEQVAIYPHNAGITYPVLLRGAQNGILSAYNTTYHHYFIIDGDGVIVWRGGFDDATMRAVIAEALAPLPAVAESWSGVKALYRR